MPRAYSAGISATGSAKCMLILQAPSDRAIQIVSAELTNETYSTGEQLYAGLYRRNGGSTPAGDSITEKALDESNTIAASATALGDLSTEPTWETAPLHRRGFSNIPGFKWVGIPNRNEIWIEPDGELGLRCLASPTLTTVYAEFVWIEY